MRLHETIFASLISPHSPMNHHPSLRSIAVAFLLLLALAPRMHAQQTVTLEGTVTDAESGDPIVGATIQLVGTMRRTYTFAGGRFRLPVPAGEHRISVTLIGYRTVVLPVSSGSPNVKITLSPSSVKTSDVRITAPLTARQVVERAIARKEENQAKAKTVQGLLYTKTSLGIEGEAFGRIEDQDRDFIFETFARAYYSDRGPRLEIIQRRQTANIPAEGNLLALGNFVTFYDDEIPVLNTMIPTPLNGSTLGRYEFELQQSTELDDEMVYVITVKPATRMLPAFEGTMKILAKSYTLVEVDLKPSGTTAVTFVRDLRFRQRFEKIRDDIWQPTYLAITALARVELIKGLAEIDANVNATSVFTELRVNEPIADSVYADKQIIAAAPDADSARPEFWEKNALSELSQAEKATYERVDSLVTLADTTQGSSPGIPISPYVDFNRVGSITLGVDLEKRFAPVRLEGFGAYSFGLRRPLGNLTAVVTLPLDTGVTIGASAGIFSELGTMSSDTRFPRVINTAIAALFHRDYYDYFRKDGYFSGIQSGYDDLRLDLRAEFSRQFNASNHTSRSIFVSDPFRENPSILEGNFRVATAGIQWGQPGAFTISSSPSADFGARITGLYGEKSGTGLSFRAAEGLADLTLPTIPTGYAPMQLRLGAQAGQGASTLPPQYQFRMRTSTSFLGTFGSFYSAPVGAYGGTRYLALHAEHNFTDYLWRLVGLPTYNGRGLEILASAASGYFENANSIGYRSTGGEWYTEAGFGLGKIPIFISDVIFLRFDARWGIGEPARGRFGAVVTLSSPF